MAISENAQLSFAGVRISVIQAPKLEPRIMRYELTDCEWTAIRPMLPTKTRGVSRVDEIDVS
jgi:hypothetical protein